MVAVAALVGVLVAGIAIPFAAVAGLGARSVADGMDKLPRSLTAEPLAQRTRVLAADGSTLATWFVENRVNVPLDKVSPIMRKAIISIEDYRFYQHGALDLKGTLRALITNQANGGVVQGGSSITQQMVKQTLINQADSKKEILAAQADTFERKFRELQYAIAFEQKYSKDWILERYLNVSYFGDGVYGIEAAAQHYFSRPASKLKLRQAALLAGIVKNPTDFDPTNDPAQSRLRRDTVLNTMAKLNVISRSEARKATKRSLGLKVRPTPNGCVGTSGEFFCDYVREYLLADKSLGKTLGDRKRLLKTGGLTIQTTLDPGMQKAADTSVSAHVRPTDQAIGGLAMVEPGTGKVRALSQSRPMGSDRSKGQTYLNYVVPAKYGDANGFQAGSTFKAFVLASAIDQGVPLNTQIRSPQSISIAPSQLSTCDGPLRSNDVWNVSNSTGSGDSTYNLYSGTQNSINTFFAQLETRTGLCEPVTLARQMGIEVPDEDVVGPFTLGVTDTDPLTMASAYATFAARGEYCEPRPVTKVTSATGEVLAEYSDKCRRLLPDFVGDAVNDVLRGVQEPGGFGYSNGLGLGQPSAAKTGTIQENRAVWYVGYTPNLAAAAMLAGANSLGHPITLNGQVVGGQSISRAFGSTQAGPIWGDAMHAIEARLPDTDFTTPDPTAVRGRLVVVPSVSGLSTAEASSRLRDAGFIPQISSTVASSAAAGTTAYTTPAAGASVGTGSTVLIYVSSGTPPRADNPPSGNGGGNNNGRDNGRGNGNGNGNGGGNGGGRR